MNIDYHVRVWDIIALELKACHFTTKHQEGQAVSGRRGRVLIVEDDVELAGALTVALSRQFEVVTVADGPEALEVTASQHLDLMLLDLILPRGTGVEVLHTLAAAPETAPPVIVMSALGRDVDLSPFAAVLAGQLCKPFGLEELERQVTEAIAGRKQSPAAASRGAVSVLLVDDDQELLEGMAGYLRKAGYSVHPVSTAGEALERLGQERFDIVVTDWIMPGGTGTDLLERVKRISPGTPVLLLTGYGTPDFTRHAIAAGAADILVKPFQPLALPVAVEKCLQQAIKATILPPTLTAATQPPGRLEPTGKPRFSSGDIIGTSAALQRARSTLWRAAQLDSSVLIRGETGSGKELFAQVLHQLSPRGGGPFVALNAAAIPESLVESELFGYTAGAFTGARKEGQKGKFLQADGGTLFLDEIGDLPLQLQVKLLRVLQEGEVDLVGGGTRHVSVRVVTATHRDLEAMVEQGTFRRDLYYRLNVVTINLPPLRDRPEDIAPLARGFLEELCVRYSRTRVQLSSEVIDLLARYDWPGNVRELRNVVERAFAFCAGDLILPVDLPPGIQAAGASRSFGPPKDLFSREREAIMQALAESGGNKVRAANLLGISRAGLYVKLKVYGIT